MKRLFCYMKDLVSSSEGNETTEAQDSEPCGSGDETAMTIPTPQEEKSAASSDSNEMEQILPDESPLNVECPKQQELEASSTELSTMQAADTGLVPAPLDVASAAGDTDDGGKAAAATAAAAAATAAAAVATAAAAVAAATDDQQTNSSGTDTCSWEPKTKDVKVALTDKGGNNAVNTEAEQSAGKHAIKPDVIHPLQNSWGIWCFMQNRSQDWHENVRHISNFCSVEDFWSLFSHIRAVDSLPIGCDYYIFKANIQPMWEDKANINGGRWLLKIPQSHPNFVHLWTETLLLLVGEAFESESESICGAVAQVRRGLFKISIWTREAADRGACMRIGYRWKSCIKAAAPIHYEAHMEVNRKGGRRSKSVYSIN